MQSSREQAFTNAFRKAYKKLKGFDAERVKRTIADATLNPASGKQLVTNRERWSRRVGDLRIIYKFDDRTITFIYCGDRDEVYDLP